jgi:hypothetical protein
MIFTLNILVEFELKEIVYLKTDLDQKPRIVLSYIIDDGTVMYKLAQGTNNEYHYAFEISREKDIVLTTSN